MECRVLLHVGETDELRRIATRDGRRDLGHVAASRYFHLGAAREVERVVRRELIFVDFRLSSQADESRFVLAGRKSDRRVRAVEDDPAVVQMARGGRPRLDGDVPAAMLVRRTNNARLRLDRGKVDTHLRSSFFDAISTMTPGVKSTAPC